MREAFAYWHIWNIYVWNFNNTLTNDVVSFEQPAPGVIINTHYLVLPLSRTYFHSLEGVRAIEVWLYTAAVIFRMNISKWSESKSELEQVGRGSRIPPASVTALYIK